MLDPATPATSPNFIRLHGQNLPHKPAVVGAERSLTFGERMVRADALGRALYARGLRPGDHAGIMTYNLPERIEISAALKLLQMGTIAVPYHMKPAEIEYIVNNSVNIESLPPTWSQP